MRHKCVHKYSWNIGVVNSPKDADTSGIFGVTVYIDIFVEYGRSESREAAVNPNVDLSSDRSKRDSARDSEMSTK